MRYSMLVYLTQMSRTLLEAAEYLTASPKEDPMREELLGNGRQMLDQIRAELERHQRDLKSGRPMECLKEVKENWGGDGEECTAAIRQFVQCLPQEVRYQVRAVFFAELGEKWDSMETVYEFMRDDPRFDPVVVLTPVYRQVRDEKGGEKHDVIYKDYLTPMGIPFLEYNEYSLEEDCPDLAFISQPYESCTLREFWPEYIAQYTRLVYLPYFLSESATNDSVMSLAQLPVYRYAWKVVCATEEQYKFYCKHSVHGGVNALLTGMPKLDKLVNLKKDGIARPKGWDCLEGKTVFLWNSWYDAGASSIRYFDELMEWFKTHEDCALIWRPHPMTDTVTKLYYPGQYQKLQKNIQQVDSLPNVIMDRETSYKAAFCYSDALISDPSSLIILYLLMDKPTLALSRNGYSPSPSQRNSTVSFVEAKWRKSGRNIAEIFNFCEQIRAGADEYAKVRKEIRQRDLALADGHSAERICEALWTEMHREDL